MFDDRIEFPFADPIHSAVEIHHSPIGLARGLRKIGLRHDTETGSPHISSLDMLCDCGRLCMGRPGTLGLTGTWSANCGQPATVSGFHTIFSRDADGLARRELDFGAKSIYATIVDGAEIISSSMLKITVRNADPKFAEFNGKTFWTVFLKENDPQTEKAFRIRFFQSITTEGKIVVKDGIDSRFGKPSPWLYKCRSALS
ncbi:hypothetical protein JQ634_08925 [Bradyrhizobium sp. AUGA SZCCT0240]|uniref:hypothetical protein n=1 Tax=unclassified Bradyrhizobium TaxID=2631580 RepID=UPI001BAE54E2|nr:MULTISPECIES: hypothetical protein [unclassified Bradyrhizobium]MBR1198364.1 hypothetical protein [Bradyrhizobium sp. AUGA SZCCT0158]MBR1243046.1 hypothetical protein [Bradyrhizobium sp. AUGA SZCCT0274]MBR1253822.1 hypothetical protein [Bradyrhizobium sp. AUGA SZCCT0240]